MNLNTGPREGWVGQQLIKIVLTDVDPRGNFILEVMLCDTAGLRKNFQICITAFQWQTLKTPAMMKTWSRVRGSWNSPASRESRSSLTARAPAGRRKIPLVHEPSWYRNVSMSCWHIKERVPVRVIVPTVILKCRLSYDCVGFWRHWMH